MGTVSFMLYQLDHLQGVGAKQKYNYRELRALTVKHLTDSPFIVKHFHQYWKVDILNWFAQDSNGQPLDISHFVTGGDWCQYLTTKGQTGMQAVQSYFIRFSCFVETTRRLQLESLLFVKSACLQQ